MMVLTACGVKKGVGSCIFGTSGDELEQPILGFSEWDDWYYKVEMDYKV